MSMPQTSTRLGTAPPTHDYAPCSLRPTLNPASHPLLPAPCPWPPYPPSHPGAFAPLRHGRWRQHDAAESRRPAAMGHPSSIRNIPRVSLSPPQPLARASPIPCNLSVPKTTPILVRKPHQSSYTSQQQQQITNAQLQTLRLQDDPRISLPALFSSIILQP